MLNRDVAAAFVISAAALIFQFTLTRVLSVLYWQHLVYAILTTSLLGFAASGTALKISKRLQGLTTTELVRFCFAGFALSSVLGVWLASWLAGDFFTLGAASFTASNGVRLALSYFFSAVPFFFFGLLVLGLFSKSPGQSGVLYAGNLLGSGLGSLLYLGLMRPLGALGVLRWLIFLPSALAVLFPGKDRTPVSKSLAFALLAALVATGFVDISPDRHKQYWTLSSDKVVEKSEWNAISRVDVIRVPKGRQRHILIDGDAQTALVPPADRVEREVRFRMAEVGSEGFRFATTGWTEVSALFTLELSGRETARNVVLQLTTGGNSYLQNVSVPAGRPVSFFASWRAEDKASRVAVDFGQFEMASWPSFALGPETTISVQDGALLKAMRVWDKALDRAELYAFSPNYGGYERVVSHDLFKKETGRAEDRVLVIGNGGGADSVAAARAGAMHITAVEVNPTSYSLVKDVYRDYLGDFFARSNVDLKLEDGRSFVRRSTERFDLIALVGVDSLAAANSGAYVLAESFLYTAEALDDYWAHLSTEGKLQISRWHFPKTPRETLRIFSMAYESLARNGVADPTRHLAMIAPKGADQLDGCFATLLVSKAPFSAASLPVLASLDVLFHPLVDAGPRPNAFHRFIASARDGKAEAFYQAYPFNVKPVTDDAPFFFHYGKFSQLLRPYEVGVAGFDSILGRWPFFVLAALVLQCLLGGVLLVLPLARHLEKGKPSGFAYFSCLGIGFMFVEMFLVQKLVLMLGHPMYSLGVTLPSLLGAAALGSYLSRGIRLDDLKTRLGLFAAIAAVICMLGIALPSILEATLPLSFSARVWVCALITFPVGILLGMPFPSGLRALPPSALCFAWGVNGAFGVLASVVAVILAMQFGFSFLLILSAFLYASAALVAPVKQSVSLSEPARPSSLKEVLR